MTDTLSEVLAVTRLKATAPWGIALPQRRRAPFYMVTKGRCEIVLHSVPSAGASLGPGDLVVLPGGSAHALPRVAEHRRRRSSSSSPAIPWTSAGT
jgi:hypothetical protein